MVYYFQYFNIVIFYYIKLNLINEILIKKIKNNNYVYINLVKIYIIKKYLVIF